MASVLIKKGTKANYTALGSKDANTMYICTDTGEIFIGSVQYGGSSVSISLAFGSSTTNSTTGRTISHTFGAISAANYNVSIIPTLTSAPTTSTAGSLGEFYVVKNADGTFMVYNTGDTGIAFDWQAISGIATNESGIASASDVSVTDTGDYFTATDAEGIFAEIGAELDSISTTLAGLV